MDRDIYIITPEDEMWIGKVKDVLSDTRQDKFSLAVRDIVDGLVFGNNDKNYAVCTIEIR